MIQNPLLDINVTEPETNINSFWLASFYGHGNVMRILAESEIDIFNTNNKTGSNALHIAI